jgi:multiple sugar transport system ATP-binding protein
MAEVVFEHVTCRYAGATEPAVSALDLVVTDGELLVLCGAPESGKSTVLRMVAGLVPVTEGRILVGGQRLGDEPAPLVSMVFQNYALYPHLTVRENIGLPFVKDRAPKHLIGERVAVAAGHLDLTAMLNRSATELSAGQRIRVALARGLLRNPAVMLMDDPLANLQGDIRAEVVEMLVAAQRQHQITTLYASSDAEEALALGDRVALLDGGVLRELVVPSELGPATPGQRSATGH